MANKPSISLSDLAIPKLPLRYGTETCYITLSDSAYTLDTIALRNTKSLGKFINYVELSPESHESWLSRELDREDALNFALIANGSFAGTLSLYNIRHGEDCEFGRMMIPEDGRRIYALAAELLGMSFAFEVLGVQTLYCVVAEGNDTVLRFHLRNGWKTDSRYERCEAVNGASARLIGLSHSRLEWRESFQRMRVLAKRLFSSEIGAAL